MAPTPLVAPYRLTLKYTVSGLGHKFGWYLRTAASADPFGFNTVARAGFSAAGVSTLGAAWWNKIKAFFDPSYCSFDSELLEANVGGSWLYIASQAATVAPTGSGAPLISMGICLSGKDTANKNFPVYIYEGIAGVTQKVTSYAALNAGIAAMVNAVFNAGGTAVDADPVAWRVSRGNYYSQRWLAFVNDSNEKLRRIRHIK